MKVNKESITIRPTTRVDLADLIELWNDSRVMIWVGFPEGLGYDCAMATEWFDRLSGDPNRHHFIILSDRFGFCGEAYYAVNPGLRRAGLDIKLRADRRGGGRAVAALRALIDLVFKNESGVDAVWTEPAVNNLAARTLYWQCGLRLAEKPASMAANPGFSYWELRREVDQVTEPTA